VSDFDYSHYGMLLKLGVAWQTAGWNAGVSVTTPTLGVFGSGRAGYTLSLAGTDADGNGRPDPPFLATEDVEGLDSDYHSPWAVGFGASRRVGQTRLYLSAEWYGAVDGFTVLALPDGSPAIETLTQELGSVLNAGVGFEHVVSDDVSVYGAFHTDFSAAAQSAASTVAMSDWDLYHFSGGASLRVGDNRFTLGASWATGGKKRSLDSPVPPESMPGTSLGEPVDIRYSKITFLLGFMFGS
jgi:hypothetical protein